MLILVVIEERERVRERANPMWSSKEKKNVLKKPKRIGPSQKRQCFKKHEKLLIISSSDEFEDQSKSIIITVAREREKKKRLGCFLCPLGMCSRRPSGLTSHRTTPTCWDSVSRVTGPFLTPALRRPWQDVCVQKAPVGVSVIPPSCHLDSSELSPLKVSCRAWCLWPRQGAGTIISRMLRAAAPFCNAVLNKRKCLVYEWFFCKNKLM